MKLKFWDNLRLNIYSHKMNIIVKQIEQLERYSKKTKSSRVKQVFKLEIKRLFLQFQNLDCKARKIEDKYSDISDLVSKYQP